jgi:hypothetical protein
VHLIVPSRYSPASAYYFAWLGFYTTWLIVPTIIGIIVFFYGVGVAGDHRVRACCWLYLCTHNFGQDVKDICESTYEICPLCATCAPWLLKTICTPYKARCLDVCCPCNTLQVGLIFDNSAAVAFGIIMSLWASFFIDFWKRKSFTVC